MMRVAFLAVCVMVGGLSGCFSGDSNPQAAPRPSTQIPTTSPATDTPMAATTNTLWLRTAPLLATTFPSLPEPETSAFPNDIGLTGIVVASLVQWNFLLGVSGLIGEANATIWFRIPANSVNPANSNPNNPPRCPFTMHLSVVRADGSSEGGPNLFCPWTTNAVLDAGGDIEVKFSSNSAGQASSAAAQVGDTLELYIGSAMIPPPAEAVQVISSSLPFESRIEIAGLDQPVQETLDGLLGTT